MGDEDTNEWSVVTPRKTQKSSPKAQTKKGLKRTDIQRSSSSNQINNRRKTSTSSDKLAESARPVTRSTKTKQVSSDGTVGTNVTNVTANAVNPPEPLSAIIEDVSSKIKLMSIEEGVERLDVNDDKRKEVSFSKTVGAGVPTQPWTLSTQAFCDLCRNYQLVAPEGGKRQYFQTRALINTGSACFWNTVMQALFAVDVFQRLLGEMLERTRLEGAQLDERMRCWRELLQLAEEFYEAPAPALTSEETNGKAHASSGKKGSGAGDVKGRKTTAPATRTTARKVAVAATALMPTLYQTFQRQMDGISEGSRDVTIGSNGASKVGKKSNQQDAVEFLTFLLDALHEEIVQVEAENARRAAETQPATAVGKLSREGSSAALGNLSTDDYDLISMDSRQNSYEMAIALTRQNSLATAPGHQHAEADPDDGWSTVASKSAKSKVKAVVVDTASKERADSASSASIISRLFHGTLRSEVTYKAKKTNSVTFQRFHCLTLDVGAGGASGSVSLENCLATYFAEESIDEGKVRKQLKLDSLPEILVLQLGRFSFDYHKFVPIKIQKNVEYPATLELSASLLSEEVKSRECGSPRYQLQAVVLHHGKKATGGHYTAFSLDVQRHALEEGVGRSALRDTRVWRSVNDAKVSVVSEAQVLGAQDTAYILFYGRIRD